MAVDIIVVKSLKDVFSNRIIGLLILSYYYVGTAMKAIIIGSTKHLFLAAVYASIGIALALLATGIYLLNARPELSLWHTVELENEFHYNTKLANFNEYLALEERLFAEVERKVVQKIPTNEFSPVNRYVKIAYPILPIGHKTGIVVMNGP